MNDVTDFTRNGKCSNCGACCTATLPMSKKELKAIKDYVKKNKVKTHTHKNIVLEDIVDLTCPFRNKEQKICEIYPVRPWICRKFVCNNPHLINLTVNKKNTKPVNLRRFFGDEAVDKVILADSLMRIECMSKTGAMK